MTFVIRKRNYRVVITGATSFIGKRVIKLVSKHFKKADVLCLVWDKDTPLEKEGREIVKKLGLKMMKVDLTKKSTLKNIPQNPKVVIHLASNTDASTRDHVVNDLGTKNLINALGKLDSKTHIVYTSTTVFMSGRPDCSQPINEKSRAYPTNEYSRTKYEAEKYLLKQCKKQKFKLTVLKLNTVYGPLSRPKSLFKIIPQQVKKGSLLTRLNWPGLTSIVHVDDVASAIVHFAATRKKSQAGKPEKYILYAENLPLAEICKEVHRALKIKYEPINLPSWFWRICASLRNLTPYFENILPYPIYNSFWRVSMLVDDVINCKTNEIKKAYPSWKPKKLPPEIRNIISGKHY